MAVSSEQSARADDFAGLHRPGEPLLLPNAWDAGSAAVTAAAGARAVATTSGGVAWSLGAPDGRGLDPADAAAVIARIVAAVDVPVTADIEDGYGATPADVAATVTAIAEAGAVGVNLEDSPGADGAPLRTPEVQAERLAAAREAADRLGLALWINARTDTYLRNVGDPDGRIDATLERARLFADAGASSLFVPGCLAPDALAAFVAGPLPVNAMVWPGAPSVSELAALGIARISLGTTLPQAAYALAQRCTVELLEQGTYDTGKDGLPYPELNGLLTR
jgi:2-methylisocitrate lyase-like PEP mutase family enzyme